MSLWPRAHREVLCCGVLFGSIKMMRVIRPKKKAIERLHHTVDISQIGMGNC